ncbi:MAG: energy transducer TonB [Candidatus Kapaibacterium sp.]|nr:MAG: energy transducer TonB [Candidatus Kapabacteria bacterium]
MNTLKVLAITSVAVLSLASCDSKNEPAQQKDSSQTAQGTAGGKGTSDGASGTGAASSTAEATAAAAADSLKAAQTAKATADSLAAATAKQSKLDDKVEEASEETRKKYPSAYDTTPVDKEPETDMAALRKAIEYPKEAKAKNIEGKVQVRALIGVNGRVVKSFIENSTHPIFNEPAQSAVKKTTFTPATRKGKRIPRWVTVPITYRLVS